MPQIGILASKMSIGDAAITAVFGYVVVFFGLLLLMLVLYIMAAVFLGLRSVIYTLSILLFQYCLIAFWSSLGMDYALSLCRKGIG